MTRIFHSRLGHGPNAEYLRGAWVIWANAGRAMRPQGWKLHVYVGRKRDAQPTLDLVLPFLRAESINHKFWHSDRPVLNDADENQGKWFVVYPESTAQALSTANWIEQLMHNAGIAPLNTDLAGEIKVGQGYVYTRYGSYDSKVVVSPEGRQEFDARGVKAHPGWVQNVWLHYSALTQPGSRVAARLPSDWMAPFPAADARGR